MITYADEEYSSGLYKKYIEAKNLKYDTFRSRLPKIQAALPNGGKNGKLLDVGCSCGYFIDVALETGFDAYGIEFSSVAIGMASPAARPRIIQGNVNTLDSAHTAFDVITAFDIIEHTDNPLDFLQNLKSILKPTGIMVLTTPDTGHFLRPLMGSRWPMLQPLQHTFLFSKASLSRALQLAGFIDIEITTAHKVLTLDYLIKQLKIHNPLIYRSYGLISPLIPKIFREKAMHVNIGEIFAIARRPNS
jgi:2-polyprenyl-3-methyl-5-hydroxy-6-metoxy-1,4-benzoquinol methylase